MTSKEKEIMTNIIGGVESGGQIYGERKYSAYVPPYNASPDEHTITLGWAQFYGGNAYKLINNIYKNNPSVIPENIKSMLNKDWVTIRWNPTNAQKQSLISAITSEVGKKCQDELFIEITEPIIKEAETYTDDVGCQIMYVEIAHLGGNSAAKRIFNKISKPYTVDKIFNTLLLDQSDYSNNNQVGDKTYQSRHECCVKWIKQYLYNNSATTTTKGSDNVAEQEILGGQFISNSGSDENGRATGGKAGDQTQKEWTIRGWYNRPWDCVLRHPDTNVARKISELAIKAARNDKIGYNQNNRNSYWLLLRSAGYDPAKITTPCDADCSAGVIANVKAVGYLLGITKLQNIWATYTGNMRQAFYEAGFQILSGNKFLTSPDYLLPGDILLNDVHHTATCVSTGIYAKKTTESTTPTTTPTTSTATQSQSTSGKWIGIVNKNNAKARTWAGKKYDQVSFSPLKKGTKIEIQYSLKSAAGNDWYYFKLGDKYAFIVASSVDRESMIYVSGGTFNIKSNAELRAIELKNLGYTSIEIIERSGQYIVRVKVCSTLAEANNLVKELESKGMEAAVVKV